jgi:succinoglycan biosynthesis protein ExoM
MNRVVICIPTYKRPDLLKELLLSIAACNIDKSLIEDLQLIIADNDNSLTALSIVNLLKEELNASFQINYLNFPVKGLSNIRNELLRNAFQLNPDLIVFIDDDEKVTTEWLNALVRAIVQNNGDMAMGPVLSVFGDKASKYISCWIERPNFPNYTKMDFVRSGNLIIKVESLLSKNIWFDQRFNYTGGEDSFFGLQMIKKGATIYWAAAATVIETVPESRANIKWLLKRYYNGANIYTRILKLDEQYTKLMIKTLVSFIYIISGICTAVIGLIPIQRRYWGLLKLSEGLGGLAGLFSIKYNEYK